MAAKINSIFARLTGDDLKPHYLIMREGQSGFPSLVSYEPDTIRNWIKSLCKWAGVAPTRLAKEAGVAATTVNRFLNNPDIKYQPGSSTLKKLEAAARRLRGSRSGAPAWEGAASESTPTFDAELMKQAIILAEMILRGNSRATPEKVAEVVLAIYNLAKEQNEEPTVEKYANVVRLLVSR